MPGDAIQTYDGRLAQLGLSFVRTVPAATLADDAWMRPVRIAPGALGQGLPQRELIVSPQHRLLINSPIATRMFGTPEVLIAARKLVGVPGIEPATVKRDVTYVHLVFERHEVIFAEGAPTESFFPGPEALRTLPRTALRALDECYPHYLHSPEKTFPVRPIPTGRKQRNLVERLLKNGKRPLGGRLHRVA
jgi:hypothetical protein